jgi:hypothetical protein
MVEFNWLHLTDLHWGMSGFKDRWWNVEQDFFEDLENLIKNAELGSLDLVLFTGDLVYSGLSEEFEDVNQQLIQPLWAKFGQMDFEPKLLAVPGNHDLRRPQYDLALLSLLKLWHDPKVHDPFWKEPEFEPRRIVESAFANYTDWWQETPLKPEIHSGILPGDFSATIEKERYKLGIVGLNSSFLQLMEGNQKGNLALHNRQFNGACDGGKGARWVKEHDLCLLLTHHPQNWLTEQCQSELDAEIYRPGRFALHLFGHMHDPELRSVAVGGGEDRRRLQGCSLFALDGYGEDNNKERTHGYSLGQLKIEDDKAHMRIWPRKARKMDGVWVIGADNGHFMLPDDRGTARQTVKEAIAPRSKPSPGNGSSLTNRGVPLPEVEPHTIDLRLAAALGVPQQEVEELDLSSRLDALKASLKRVKEQSFSWQSELHLRVQLEPHPLEECAEKDLWGLDSTIEAQLGHLKIIRKSLERAEKEENDAIAGQFIKEAWRGYARVCDKSQRIFREWLDLTGGLTLRAYELDKSLFNMADQLIRDCAVASGVSPYLSIPAAHDDLTRTTGRVIRLRFPEWTLWDLPFAAYEYGQVVVDKVEVLRALIEDTTANWADQDREWQPIAGNTEEQNKKRYNHELRTFLADAFATHTIGPAYACTAILLRFDPLLAYDERAAYDKRARVVLAMLERMDEEADGSPYKEMIERLENHWSTTLARANPLGGVEAIDEERLNNLVGEIWQKITDEYKDEMLYPPAGETGWQVAKTWAVNWMQQLEASKDLSIWAVPSNSKLRDVLNAMWLCRISYPKNTDEIAGAAYGQCEAIITLTPQDTSRLRVGLQTPAQTSPKSPLPK